MSDALERLRDVLATRDDRSHVDAATRLRIGGLILQAENEELNATARRLVAALPADDLAAMVADWLDAQAEARSADSGSRGDRSGTTSHGAERRGTEREQRIWPLK